MKRVNISTRLPIRSVNPPITGRKNNIELSTQDIRACILSGAFVDEILPDGSTVRLSLSNYTKDNYVAKPEVKVETPVTVEEATAVEKVEEKEAEAVVDTTVVADENEIVVSTDETVTVEDTTPVEKVEEKETEAVVNTSEEATVEQEQIVVNTNARNKRKNKR